MKDGAERSQEPEVVHDYKESVFQTKQGKGTHTLTTVSMRMHTNWNKLKPESRHGERVGNESAPLAEELLAFDGWQERERHSFL